MKKKSGNKDLDNELNFDDLDDLEADGGMDFGGIDDIDMSERKPSAREVGAEMAKEAGQGFLDGTARKAAEKALPESYKDNYYAAVDYADFAKETFQSGKSKINKSLYNLGKEVKKILPFQSKMLDGFLEKYESDFEAFKSQTEEQIREGSIQSDLGSIFDKQLEVTKALEAKRGAEGQADRKQQLAINKVNLEVFTSIDNNIANQTAFTLQISKEYYRKSLELQYKSYFIQADMLKDMRDYYKGFSKQLEDISLNTSLPDFVKLHKTEAIKQIMRDQMAQNVYKQIFSNSEYVANVKKRVGNLVNEKISGITDGIDSGTDILAGLNSAGEMGGGTGMLLGGIASNMGGGILGEKAGNWLGDKLGTKTKDNKYVKTGGNYLNMLANSPRTLVAMLRGKTKAGLDEYQDESTPMRFLASKLLGGADELLGAADPTFQKQEVKKANIMDHNKPAIFDNKVHRSISEVIPMYLGKILHENTNLRKMYLQVNQGKLKGFEEKDEQVYNYVDRKLSTKQEFANAVQDSVFKDSGKQSKKIDTTGSTINSLAIGAIDRKADKDKYKVLSNKKNQKAFNDFLSVASEKFDTDNFTYDNVVKKANENEDLKTLLANNKGLKEYVETLQSLSLDKKHKNLNESVKDTKRIFPTLAVVELFREASRLTGSKQLNNIEKGGVANLISKAFVSYLNAGSLDRSGKPITLESICDASAFTFMSVADKEACWPAMSVFIPQCRMIQAEDDLYKNSQINMFISMVNESLSKSFEFNDEVFQTIHDYDSSLQGSGKLGINNLVIGKFGADPETELVERDELVKLTKINSKGVKKILEAKTKSSIVDTIQSGVVGQTLDKFKNIGDTFKKEMGEAEGIGGMKNAVKNLAGSIAKESQAIAKKAYEAANESLNKAYVDIDKMLVEKSAGFKTKVKESMLKAADKYINDIDALIRKEEEAAREEQATISEMTNNLQEDLDDPNLQQSLTRMSRITSKAKQAEIKLLRDFKGKLQKHRNLISNINTDEAISLVEFQTQARNIFNTFMEDARNAIKEYKETSQQLEEAI